VQLAECSRAGQLSAVWIPDPEDDAIRDLSRAREDAVIILQQVAQKRIAHRQQHGDRIDALWLTVQPVDMRAGVNHPLARVVQVFCAAQVHHG
jgi:hypothetical protein